MNQKCFAAGWSEIDPVLQRFEQAWQSGIPPSLGEFLSIQGVVEAPTRRRLLEELIKIDLENRWRRSAQSLDAHSKTVDKWRLEDYLRRIPELEPTGGLSLDLIGYEYQVRQRWGDRPDHSEYIARFADRQGTVQERLRQIDIDLKVEFSDSLPSEVHCGAKPSANGRHRPTPRELLTRRTQSGERYVLSGEIARGGMGAVLRAWMTTFAAKSPSSICSTIPTSNSNNASSRRRRSPASWNILTSCPSTNWASMPAAACSSP